MPHTCVASWASRTSAYRGAKNERAPAQSQELESDRYDERNDEQTNRERDAVVWDVAGLFRFHRAPFRWWWFEPSLA